MSILTHQVRRAPKKHAASRRNHYHLQRPSVRKVLDDLLNDVHSVRQTAWRHSSVTPRVTGTVSLASTACATQASCADRYCQTSRLQWLCSSHKTVCAKRGSLSVHGTCDPKHTPESGLSVLWLRIESVSSYRKHSREAVARSITSSLS